VQLPALSRSTVDRASDLRTDEEGLREAWAAGGRLLALDASLAAPVTGDEDAPRLVWQPTDGQPRPADAVLLGREEGVSYWTLDTGEPSPAGSGFFDAATDAHRQTLLQVGQRLSAAESGMFTHAVAILTWHRNHTHCPRCGAPTEMAQVGAVRICTNDGSEHFPRIDPSMIVLVRSPDGERAVLGRGAQWPGKFYSCLAGFVEPGESAERCVEREVLEEVGLVVRDVQYQASQPWPFPSSLMLGFSAVADVAELHPQPGELADAVWFTRDEVRAAIAEGSLGIPPPVSIARGLIDDWLEA
jgi:NAD+ diphosphatase